jgi:hypothetical protein
MKGIVSLRNPAAMMPVRASFPLRAARARCTMNWFVPQ